MLLLVELTLALLAIPLAYACPHIGDSWFSAIERATRRFAGHRRLAVVTVFGLALVTRLAVLPIEPIPVPGFHDEYGYLLSGDTFAHGRLTNPTHPMWVHFESMTIIQKPTYCSAFYPAQGAFLALGQVVFKHPFWGVWLSTGLMCAAICWALQGWMPPGWAFLGGSLAIIRLGTFSYWANSYWGGSVAALGGALVMGALPRIYRKQRVCDSILFAIGLAILANSRPYEGMVYSIPVLVALGFWMFAKKLPALHIKFRRVALPLALVMAATFAFMAYYFWRATGNPFRPPYLVDVATYMSDPQFIWQSSRPPLTYHDAVLQQFYGGFHMQKALELQRGPVFAVFEKVIYLWLFFIGPAITLLFLTLALILPRSVSIRDLGWKTRFFLLLAIVSFIGLLLPLPFQPHYAAPMVCVLYALILQAMRRVRLWDRHGRQKGLYAVRATVVVSALIFLAMVTSLAIGVPRGYLELYNPTKQNDARAEIVRKLSHEEGKHLVIVHYGPNHNLHNEWVFNDADIDGSKIVWARQISPSDDQRLLHYFHSRQIWLVNADEPPRVLPYRVPSSDSTLTSDRH